MSSSEPSSDKLLKHARLERNIPGVILVLQLPAQYISECHCAGEVADICHSKLVYQLIQKSSGVNSGHDEMVARNNPTELSSEISAAAAASSAAASSTTNSVLHKISKDAHVNRFNKVVDELERKYYSYSQVACMDDDSNSRNKDSFEDEHAIEESDENVEMGATDSDLTHSNGALEKRRSKSMRQSSNHYDDYDMDDPFIDDSDMVQEIEIDLRMKKARTKQSGFFVSSGKLELAKRKTQSPLRVLKSVKKHRVRFKEPSKSSAEKPVSEESVVPAVPSSPVASSSDSAAKKALEHTGNISSPSYFADLVAFHNARPICDVNRSDALEDDKKKRKRKTSLVLPEEGGGPESTKKAPRIKISKAAGNPPSITIPLSSAADQTAVGSCAASSSTPCTDTSKAMGMTTAVDPIVADVVNESAETSNGSPIAGEDTLLTTGSQDVAVVKERKKRVVVAKPLWEPSAEIVESLSYFKSFFDRGGYTLLKSSVIPKALEEPLHALDVHVTQRYNRIPLPSTLESTAVEGGQARTDNGPKKSNSTAPIRYRNIDKTSGFHEAIHEILGGKINIGRIRYTLQKFRLRDEAAVLKNDLDALVDSFCVTLKSKIAKCPLSMQPTLKAKPSKETNTSTMSGPTVVQTSSSQHDSLEAGVNDMGECSGDGFGDSSAAMTLDTPREGERQQGVANQEGQIAKVMTKKSEKTVVITYDFFCKWDIPMRATLLNIEESIDHWIQAENRYREKLTILDKKNMAENEVTPLTLEDRLTEYLNKISIVFPSKCLRGDVENLRRAIVIEKRRLAKPSTPTIIGDKKLNDTDKPVNYKSNVEGDKTKRAMPKQVCKSDEVINVGEEDTEKSDGDRTKNINKYSNIQLLPPETLI